MWIELHDTVFDDPKVKKLSKILNIRMIEAIGHLAALWQFAAKNILISGNLEEWGIEGIEEAAKWDGSPGRFVEAARGVGLLVQNWKILDWEKYTSHHVLSAQRASRARDRAQMRTRKWREKQRNQHTVTKSIPKTVNGDASVTVCVTACDADKGTNLNNLNSVTNSNPKKRNIVGPPTAPEVADYAKTIGFEVDAERFCDYYSLRGWTLKNGVRVRDWRAAVRTWKRNSASEAKENDPRIA